MLPVRALLVVTFDETDANLASGGVMTHHSLAVLATAVLVGCDIKIPDDGPSLTFGGNGAYYSASAQDGGVNVSAAYITGFLDIGTSAPPLGDSFSVQVGAGTPIVPMTDLQVELFSANVVDDFPDAGAPGTRVSFYLILADGGSMIGPSSCSLPGALTSSIPDAGGAFSLSNDSLTLSWDDDASADLASFDVEGTCANGAVVEAMGNVSPSASTLSLERSVSLSLDGGWLSLPLDAGTDSGASPFGTCNLSITLTRKQSGTLAKGMVSGSTIVCTQSTTSAFVAVP